MSNLIKINEFKNLLNSQTVKAQIKNSLKENAGSFMSSMIDLYCGDGYLQNCNPQEVMTECLKAVGLKLPLVKSLGFAYVVPYKNKPTFTIGYKGLIQLAQRSGQYKYINADVVYEGELKSRDKLTGEADMTGEASSDKVVGYFAYIKLLNGFEKTLYMSKKEIDDWGRRYSPSYTSDKSPWKSEFDKMALKTVLRRLIKTYGVMTIEFAEALSMESEPVNPPPSETEPSKSTLLEDEIIDTGGGSDAENGEPGQLLLE